MIDSVDILVWAMKCRFRRARAYAAAEIGSKTHDVRVVKALCEALSDRDISVRHIAVTSLVRLHRPGDDHSWLPVQEILDDIVLTRTTIQLPNSAFHDTEYLMHAARYKAESMVSICLANARANERCVAAFEIIIAALKDGERSVRREATSAIGLLLDTTDRDPRYAAEHQARAMFVSAIGRITVNRGVDALCEALTDEDFVTRGAAAKALGEIGDERAIRPLCNALKDQKGYVRAYAAFALGYMPDEQALDPVCDALTDNMLDVRRSAAITLGKIRSRRATQALCKKLDDPSVSQDVATALGHIGDPSAVVPLCQALKSWADDVPHYSRVALGDIGDRITLPRKIIIDSQMTLDQKTEALNALRASNVSYCVDGVYHRYDAMDAYQYCNHLKNDQDAHIRDAALNLFEYLSGPSLLRAGQLKLTKGNDDLLRTAAGDEDPNAAETLLRAPAEHQPNP